MNMRLTSRDLYGCIIYENGETFKVFYPWNENRLTSIDRMALKLCDLEDKIEQRKIVELPCAIGQMVYCIRYDNARKQFVKPLRVDAVTVWDEGGFTVFTTKEDTWGLTAFATAEEAEAKLRELKGAAE